MRNLIFSVLLGFVLMLSFGLTFDRAAEASVSGD